MSLFSEELIIGRNFAFQNGLGLTIKTVNPNSPWAYIQESLLSEGYLCLRFGGLIFGRANFFLGGGGLLSEFYGIWLSVMVHTDRPRCIICKSIRYYLEPNIFPTSSPPIQSISA